MLGGFETRQPGKIRHLASDMFRQRVLSLAAGHEDLNDRAEFSKDPLPQSTVGRDGAPPAESPWGKGGGVPGIMKNGSD